MSSCLGRAAVPVKRVWRGLSARLRRRRTTGKLSTYVPMNPDDEREDQADDEMDFGVLAAGLGRLRKDVRTCEYHDVHVMWEMLSSNGTGGSGRVGGATMADDCTTAAGKGAAAAARRARKGRKPATWSRLVAYCCAF